DLDPAALGQMLSPSDTPPSDTGTRTKSLAAGPPDAAGAAPAPAAGRYRPVQFHAQGGLGEVHLADDAELPRQVALKRILPRWATDPASRRRFLREAEITSRLEHPGVVPVYGRVEGPDGEPCYAMRFVAGQSLRDAIARLHAPASGAASAPRDSAPRGADAAPLALRHLLTRFVAVCNAVAFAHSKGVIHRDL